MKLALPPQRNALSVEFVANALVLQLHRKMKFNLEGISPPDGSPQLELSRVDIEMERKDPDIQINHALDGTDYVVPSIVEGDAVFDEEEEEEEGGEEGEEEEDEEKKKEEEKKKKKKDDGHEVDRADITRANRSGDNPQMFVNMGHLRIDRDIEALMKEDNDDDHADDSYYDDDDMDDEEHNDGDIDSLTTDEKRVSKKNNRFINPVQLVSDVDNKKRKQDRNDGSDPRKQRRDK